jgi:hypothetical protein
VGGRQASGTLRGCLGRRRLLVHVRECSFVNNVTVLYVPLHWFVWLSRFICTVRQRLRWPEGKRVKYTPDNA